MDTVENIIWEDEFTQVEYLRERPDEQTLLEALLRDSAFSYIDDINTADTETLQQQITAAFVNASGGLLKEQDGNNLIWWKHKNPSILHLLRNSVLPFGRIGIAAGGLG